MEQTDPGIVDDVVRGLSKGEGVDSIDETGISPLFLALQSCRAPFIKCLLANGASSLPKGGLPVIFALQEMKYTRELDE